MLRLLGCLMGLCSVCALAQTTYAVGSGLTSDIQATFVTAYDRGIFSALVTTPQGDVSTFGSSGLIQLFTGAYDNTQTFALIKPDSTATSNVQQMWWSIYSVFGTEALASIGFPTNDTALCPTLVSQAALGNTCQWQPFANDYAVFSYTQSLPAGAVHVYPGSLLYGMECVRDFRVGTRRFPGNAGHQRISLGGHQAAIRSRRDVSHLGRPRHRPIAGS